MANKDNRAIKSLVRLGGQKFPAGQEDELAAAATQEQLDYLLERGAIEGTWKSTLKSVGKTKEEK